MKPFKLTDEQRAKSASLIRPFLTAMGKDCSQAKAAKILGLSPHTVSKWLIGDMGLAAEHHERVEQFIANPPVCKPKYKDSDRNKTRLTNDCQNNDDRYSLGNGVA